MGEGTIFPSPEKQDVLEILAEIQGNLLGIPVDRGHRDLAANEVRVDRLGELRQTPGDRRNRLLLPRSSSRRESAWGWVCGLF